MGRNLLIFAAHDRIHGGAYLPWADIVQVGPPRLHAKFAILQFRNETTGKIISRAIVTSANLTKGGLTRNREIVVWEDANSESGAPSLASTLLQELRFLRKETKLSTRDDVITVLGRNLPKSGSKGLVHSTIDQRTPLLPSLDSIGAADDIVIVTPAFAGESSSGPVEALRPLISANTKVLIYADAPSLEDTSRSVSYSIPFSSGVLEGFRGVANDIDLLGVPRFVTQEQRGNLIERRLHAKMIAVVHGTAVRAFVGSANLTSPALNGDNRELIVEVQTSRDTLDKFLKGLDARRHSGSVSVPRTTTPSSNVEPLPELQARFEIDYEQRASSSKWHGTLFLEWDKHRPPSRVEYPPQQCELLAEQRFVLFESQSHLTVYFGDKKG
ncbi:MAG: hypothetical protein HKN10_15025, partial [Myxococcales bacterium]|nr:hypothetical protein [Myxococcales bacterium]